MIRYKAGIGSSVKPGLEVRCVFGHGGGEVNEKKEKKEKKKGANIRVVNYQYNWLGIASFSHFHS